MPAITRYSKQKLIESNEIEGELLSNNILIEPGNYVVVSTCNTLLKAEQIKAELNEKGENHVRIVLNRAKGYFYIVTSRYSNINEALEAMEHKRQSGYTDAWVLVYR